METSGERLMHQRFPEQHHDSPLFCLPSFACVCLFHMCFVLTSVTWTSKGPREGATVREGRSRTQTSRDFSLHCFCGSYVFTRACARVCHEPHDRPHFCTNGVRRPDGFYPKTPRCHMQSARRSPQGEHVRDEHLTWLGPCFLGDHRRSVLPNLQISAVTDSASPSGLSQNDGHGLCTNLAPNQNDLKMIGSGKKTACSKSCKQSTRLCLKRGAWQSTLSINTNVSIVVVLSSSDIMKNKLVSYFKWKLVPERIPSEWITTKVFFVVLWPHMMSRNQCYTASMPT